MPGLLRRVLLERFVAGGGPFAASQLSFPSLVEFCRSIRFFLTSGMTLRDGMRLLGEKGTWGVRRTARELAAELADGWTFEAALAKQGRRFPPLFVSLAAVGEETGKLPEVMHDLEKYYELQQRQRRQLAGQATAPLIQFVLAVLVVAGLIYVLSELPQPPAKITRSTASDGAGGQRQVVSATPAPYDVLGVGLVGKPGALMLLVYVFGGIAAIWLLSRLLRGVFGKTPVIERVVLALPFVGPCARALALTRFSFAMQLMLDSSMSILKTIRLAFAATDNAAFAAAGPRAETHLRRGNAIQTALAESRLFPASYLSAAAVGEQTGHLPEVMATQAEYYDEIARRRITTLYSLLGYLVWVGVAGVIAFVILRLFNVFYLGAIEASQNVLDHGAATTAP